AEEPINVIHAAHAFPDLEMSHDFHMTLSELLRQRCVFAPAGLATTRGEYFYDLYTKVDLAVSMRIHSMNPAVGLGTPLVPLVSQERMELFFADAGLADLTVDVVDTADVTDVVAVAAIDRLRDPQTAKARLVEARDGLRRRSAAW